MVAIRWWLNMLSLATTSQSVSAITNSQKAIPENLKSALPTVEEVEEELSKIMEL